MNPKKQLLFLLALFLYACGAEPEELARRHIKDGIVRLEASRFDEAIIEFKNAVKLAPGNAEAHYNLAIAYLGTEEETPYNVNLAFRELIRANELDGGLFKAKLKLGELYLRSGRYGKARSLAGEALSKNKDDAEAKILLAEAYAGLKFYENALEELKAVIDKTPSVKAYIVNSKILLALGEKKLAEDALKKAAALDNKDIHPILALSDLYAGERMLKEAEEVLKKAYAIKKDDPKVLLSIVNFHAVSGNLRGVEGALKELAAIKPGSPKGYLRLSDFYAATRRIKKAVEACELGIRNGADPEVLNRKIAELLLDEGDHRRAAPYIGKLAKEDSKNYFNLYLTGRLKLAEGDFKGAETALLESIGAEPVFPLSRHYLGAAYAASGNTDRAKAELRYAIKLSPALLKSHLAVASLYLSSGDTSLALDELKYVLSKEPRNYSANLLGGEVMLRTGKPDEAEKFFRKAVEISPKDALGYVKLGAALNGSKNKKEAKAAFEKALSLNTASIDALSGIVSLELKQNRAGEAIKKIDSQIKLQPENPHFHRLLGLMYAKLDDLPKAEEHLKEAIELKKDLVGAYSDLAGVYSARGSLKKSAEQLEKAAALKPKTPQPYMSLGMVYELDGRKDEAEKAYRKALKSDPGFAPAANNLAWIYAEKGMLEDALKYAEAAKASLPEDPSVSDTLGWIHYKKGSYHSAVSLLRDSSEKLPDNPVIKYHLGMAYYRKGKLDDAAKELKKALKIGRSFNGAKEALFTLKEIEALKAGEKKG